MEIKNENVPCADVLCSSHYSWANALICLSTLQKNGSSIILDLHSFFRLSRNRMCYVGLVSGMGYIQIITHQLNRTGRKACCVCPIEDRMQWCLSVCICPSRQTSFFHTLCVTVPVRISTRYLCQLISEFSTVIGWLLMWSISVSWIYAGWYRGSRLDAHVWWLSFCSLWRNCMCTHISSQWCKCSYYLIYIMEIIKCNIVLHVCKGHIM